MTLKSQTAEKPFWRTGCLITVDGSEDNQITPQTLEAYAF